VSVSTAVSSCSSAATSDPSTAASSGSSASTGRPNGTSLATSAVSASTPVVAAASQRWRSAPGAVAGVLLAAAGVPS
jgi:hypothetical protein